MRVASGTLFSAVRLAGLNDRAEASMAAWAVADRESREWSSDGRGLEEKEDKRRILQYAERHYRCRLRGAVIP